ncbi:MAG: cytochrome b/b6 domain-containing protein [Burkholderiales bacterium]
MRSPIDQPTTRIYLWDLPLRIFHWLLAPAVCIAIVTAKIGGEWMEWHGRTGLAIIGLLAFRLAWGMVGSTHSRFLNFAPSPAKIRAYLKGRWHGVGHNPLGALAVFGLLGLLIAQAATGLFANDDISFNGPLFALVDKTQSDNLTEWHHQLSDALLILLGLHVIAVFFYTWFKKNNLIKPMLTGWKEAQPAEPTTGGSLAALVFSILVAVATVYGVYRAGMVQ